MCVCVSQQQLSVAFEKKKKSHIFNPANSFFNSFQLQRAQIALPTKMLSSLCIPMMAERRNVLSNFNFAFMLQSMQMCSVQKICVLFNYINLYHFIILLIHFDIAHKRMMSVQPGTWSCVFPGAGAGGLNFPMVQGSYCFL